jgi:hypothetical protein
MPLSAVRQVFQISQVGRVSGSVTRHFMPRFVGLRRKQTRLTQPT